MGDGADRAPSGAAADPRLHAETIPDFLELSGDRLHGDDRAIVAGLGTLGKQRIVLIGHQKGHTLKERQERSFGMTRPEGYRKAMRLARLAEKFGSRW